MAEHDDLIDLHIDIDLCEEPGIMQSRAQAPISSLMSSSFCMITTRRALHRDFVSRYQHGGVDRGAVHRAGSSMRLMQPKTVPAE
jgi:hypothetical protein